MKKIKWAAFAILLTGYGWVMNVPQVSANKKHTVEEHVKELKNKLDLTSDQEIKVRTIVEEKKNKMEETKQEAHGKIRDVLTDSQRTKFNEMILKKEKDGY